jgi:superfamily II DNA or RNA helicase
MGMESCKDRAKRPEVVALPAPLTAKTDWKLRYSSDEDDLLHDFFYPALQSAKYYDRAVGYFSLSVLDHIGKALEPFWDHGVKMRLVCSVKLKKEDLAALEDVYKRRSVYESSIREELSTHSSRPDFSDPISLLTGLIIQEKLEIYVATGYRNGKAALYHEKVGVIRDHANNWVTFSGSPNETAHGLVHNIESFPIHRSWIECELPHAKADRKAVEGLFTDPPERSVEVVPFYKALEEELIEIYEPGAPPGKPKPQRRRVAAPQNATEKDEEAVKIPDWLTLRDYQMEAMNEWLSERGRGRFEMATGTGKTITALSAAAELAGQCEKNGETLWVVVMVPDTILVNQWAEDAHDFGFSPVLSTSSNWRKKVDDDLLVLRNGLGSHGMLITTYGSALGQSGQLIQKIIEHEGIERPARMLLIADEAHGLGAPTRQELMLPEFDFRLALTATFNRHFDDEGTEVLEEYFQGSTFKVSLSDAIHKYSALVEYNYYPIMLDLTEEEIEEYKRLTLEIAQLWGAAAGSGWSHFEEIAKKRLLERAKIINNASEKTKAFKAAIDQMQKDDQRYMLVYSAEGTGEGESSLPPINQGKELKGVLNDAGVSSKFFNGTKTKAQRLWMQKELNDGNTDCLIAMKCLDEGIDIPEARVAFFVASTTNPKQYIQRRGRVLRKPKLATSTKTSADLYDFIVRPPREARKGDGSGLWEMERKIVARELLRALDLAEIAKNSVSARLKLQDLVSYYELNDLYIPEEVDVAVPNEDT